MVTTTAAVLLVVQSVRRSTTATVGNARTRGRTVMSARSKLRLFFAPAAAANAAANETANATRLRSSVVKYAS